MDEPTDDIYTHRSQYSRRAFIVGSLAAGFECVTPPTKRGGYLRRPSSALNDMAIAEDAYYVLASGGSDANDGKSWRTAFATIQKAAAMVNANTDGEGYGGAILLGPGRHWITTPDAFGNGVTLARIGAAIRGLGQMTTIISFGDPTWSHPPGTEVFEWGVVSSAARTHITDLTIDVMPSAVIKWGACGVTTGYLPGQSKTNGSAGNCSFANIGVGMWAAAKCRFAFAFGADTSGGGIDLNGAYLQNLSASCDTSQGACFDACLCIGNDVTGNIMDFNLHGFTFATAKYGIFTSGCGITAYGGQMGHNRISDIGHNGGRNFVVDGFRSEGSSRLFLSVNDRNWQDPSAPMWTDTTAAGASSAPSQVTLSNILWISGTAFVYSSNPGVCPFIQFANSGQLSLRNLQVTDVSRGDGSWDDGTNNWAKKIHSNRTPRTPQIVLDSYGSIACLINGITICTPIDQLVVRYPNPSHPASITGLIMGHVYTSPTGYWPDPALTLPVALADLSGTPYLHP